MLLKLGLPTGPPGLPNGDGVKETCKKSSFNQIISPNVKRKNYGLRIYLCMCVFSDFLPTLPSLSKKGRGLEKNPGPGDPLKTTGETVELAAKKSFC